MLPVDKLRASDGMAASCHVLLILQLRGKLRLRDSRRRDRQWRGWTHLFCCLGQGGSSPKHHLRRPGHSAQQPRPERVQREQWCSAAASSGWVQWWVQWTTRWILGRTLALLITTSRVGRDLSRRRHHSVEHLSLSAAFSPAPSRPRKRIITRACSRALSFCLRQRGHRACSVCLSVVELTTSGSKQQGPPRPCPCPRPRPPHVPQVSPGSSCPSHPPRTTHHAPTNSAPLDCSWTMVISPP